MDRFERGPTIRRDDRELGKGWTRRETRAMAAPRPSQTPSQNHPGSSPGPAAPPTHGNTLAHPSPPLALLRMDDPPPSLAQLLMTEAVRLAAEQDPPQPIPAPPPPPAAPLPPSSPLLPVAEVTLTTLAERRRREHPTLTPEGAMAEVLRERPDLYDAHLRDQALTRRLDSAIRQEQERRS